MNGVGVDLYYPAGAGAPSGATMGGFSSPMGMPAASMGPQGPNVMPVAAAPKSDQIATVLWTGGFLVAAFVLLHLLRGVG